MSFPQEIVRKSKPKSQTIRTKDQKTLTINNYTRTLAIKLMCTECMGYNGSEVKNCSDKHCPLFIFKKATQKAYYGE